MDLLLVCEAHSKTLADGRWRFTLEAADGELILEAEDRDFGDLNRLTLLAAVRGLESLEGASDVTLLSNNRYLIRSLSNSLPRWRQNAFMWEHFGRRIDVQHADLWRRIDHALGIHRVQACLVSSCLVSHGSQGSETLSGFGSADGRSGLRVDPPHRTNRRGPAAASSPAGSSASLVPAPSERLRRLLGGNGGCEETYPSSRRRGRFTAEDLRSE
jgi:ribonuclease HI